MKSEKLINAIGKIKEDYISEANEKKMKKKINGFELVGKLAVVGCAFILVISLISSGIARGSYYSSSLFDATAECAEESVNGGFSALSEASYSKSSDYAYEAEYDYDYDYEESSGTESIESKIIVNGDMDLECEDLDPVLETLKEAVKEYDGYFQSEELSGSGYRDYYAVIRIPAKNYDEFIENLSGLGTANHYSESRDDVTDSYYDAEGRLSNYKAEQERIQELYKSANTVAEMLEIEERLSEIQYQIEYYQSKLRNYDLLTTYSTLTLSIDEIVKYEEKSLTFFEKVAKSFTEGFENFFEGVGNLVIGIVYYLWLILLVIVVVVIVRFVRKKKTKKNNQ